LKEEPLQQDRIRCSLAGEHIPTLGVGGRGAEPTQFHRCGGSAKLENGVRLTMLASLNRAFVGLFGTVWGIYHAHPLAHPAATLDVYGRGEALIMTHRSGRGNSSACVQLCSQQQGTNVDSTFAHDLIDYFVTGNRCGQRYGATYRAG
jgi:hypothetical protein